MAEEKLVLAPGVVFDEAKHEYHLRGKQLSGVTGVIGKHLGTKFPEEFVGEARGEGLHIHNAIEKWIECRGRRLESVHPSAVWLTDTILSYATEKPVTLHAETLVSDLEEYASAVDIIIEYPGKRLDLFDMKRSFKRPAVSWQLSIYKFFIEEFTPYTVHKMWCASFRDKEYYPVFAKSHEMVRELLYKK
jgi:hypothetical protein